MGLKMNKKAIFTTFSLILALKTALELIFPAGRRTHCFARKVSYDLQSSEIMLMHGPGQGGSWPLLAVSSKMAKIDLNSQKKRFFYVFAGIDLSKVDNLL